jgi:DNA repair protein RecO
VKHFNCEAILLDVFDLHDRDRIVTFLSPWGKKRGVARGARSKFSRFAGQLQPLAKVQIRWFEKQERELVRIDGVDLIRSAHRLQSDLEGILLGSCLADHMVEFAQENETNDHLFRLLDSTLEALLGGVDRDLAARYFEIWMLRLAGVFPDPRECSICGRLFGESGALLPAGGEALLCMDCSSASGGMRVEQAVLDFLDRTSRRRLVYLDSVRPDSRLLRSVENLCSRLRRQFLQRELRSYEVMESTLRPLHQGLGARPKDVRS